MAYIYFIGNEHGAIKIGHTGLTPERRTEQLQTASADKLTILATFRGSIKDEIYLHEQFSHFRIRGEWFEATSDLLEHIQSLPEVDAKKVKEWQQATLPEGNTAMIQRMAGLQIRLEAEQIINDARRKVKKEVNEIVNKAMELIRQYAAIEIKEIITDSLHPYLFNCRCCQCGQPRPTVRERDDGRPWCNICWVNHAIFSTGRFDNIITRVKDTLDLA